MNRKDFIKTLVAACAAPAVAAKAIAAPRSPRRVVCNRSDLKRSATLLKPSDSPLSSKFDDKALDEVLKSMFRESGDVQDLELVYSPLRRKPLVEKMWGPPAETYKSTFGDVKIYKHPSAQ